MTTAITQGVQQDHHTDAVALAQSVIARAAANSKATTQLLHRVMDGNLPGVNAQDFQRDNRIHVKDGSLFVSPYLVVHPRELAPENEPTLKAKLNLTYSINNPHFYESNDRAAIALNLGQLLPVSLKATESKLLDSIKKYNAQVEGGPDAELTRQVADKHAPFAAIVRDAVEQPAKDPVGMETLKNGLSMYLLMREKVTRAGFKNKLTTYVTRKGTPDQVLADLAEKTGVAPLTIREAALKGGVDGVGQALGLEQSFVDEVKQITDYAAQHDFSYNAVRHWHLGRQLPEGANASLQEKVAIGQEARVLHTIDTLRREARQHFDVPDAIKTQEKQVADALMLTEPVQRALMHKLGYEVCYTPEVNADAIAFFPGIYGLHRKSANNKNDIGGTYRIYFSGHGDMKASHRTLVHEVAHNLWPAEFSAEEQKKIDALAKSDAVRLEQLNKILTQDFGAFDKLVRAYKAGNAQEQAAVSAAAQERYAPFGVSIDANVLGHLRDAHDLKYLVKHATETLSEEGIRYTRSNYDSPTERFREMISRFAELKQVELRGEPQLLQFVAPGMNAIWENHYLPHLERVYQRVAAKEAAGTSSMAREEAAVAPVATPKVEERPRAPLTNADISPVPENRVLGSSIAHTPQTIAALNVLNAQGVQSFR